MPSPESRKEREAPGERPQAVDPGEAAGPMPGTLPQAAETTGDGLVFGADAAPPPKQIGRYELRRLLGRGAFGAVYQGFDPQLEREVAIKVLRPDVLESEDSRQRFQREAKATARLLHPNIVPAYDAGTCNGCDFIAYALIPGRTLKELIPEEGLPPRKAASLALQMADALAYAHDQGIIHRDVKPGNIIVGEKDRPYLLDFGLVASIAREGQQLTNEGDMLGTPAYMSPEQAEGKKELMGPAVDQYSLGIVFWHMLVGRPPFSGPLAGIIYQVMNKLPESPTALRPHVDAALSALCLRAVAKEPQQRFASCREFAQALRNWLKGTATQQATLAARPDAQATVRQEVVVVRPSPAISKTTQAPGRRDPTKAAARPPTREAKKAAKPSQRKTMQRRPRTVLYAGLAGGVAAVLILFLCLQLLWPRDRGQDAASGVLPAKQPPLASESTSRPLGSVAAAGLAATAASATAPAVMASSAAASSAAANNSAAKIPVAPVPALAGTYWQGKGSQGEMLGFHFRDGGKADLFGPEGGPSPARWRLDGDRVFIELEDRFAEYWGTVAGDAIRGAASNVRKDKWEWQVSRSTLAQVPRRTESLPNPPEVPRPVENLSGTWWQGKDGEGKSFTLRLLAGGAAVYSQAPLGYRTCSWKLNGNQVTLSLKLGQFTEVAATLKDGELRGSATAKDNRRWEFLARRIQPPSPPVPEKTDALAGTAWTITNSQGASRRLTFRGKGLAELESRELLMEFSYRLNGKKVTLEYRGPNPSGMQLQFQMATSNFGGPVNRQVEKLDRDTLITIKLEGMLADDTMSGSGVETYTKTLVQRYSWTAAREP